MRASFLSGEFSPDEKVEYVVNTTRFIEIFGEEELGDEEEAYE